jgi:hypothetical protein
MVGFILLLHILLLQYMNNHRHQILYQKTDFNSSKICQLNGIFKCCKCRKNNSVMVQPNALLQLCLFCGTPNQLKKEISCKKM